MRTALSKWVSLGGLLALSASLTWAQNPQTLQSVSIASQSGAEIVRFDFANPVDFKPNGFGIQSPARVAIDLPAVGSALNKNTVEFAQGNVRSVNVIQASDRTRLVLNLKKYSAYTTQVDGKSVLITFEPSATGAPVAAALQNSFAESRNADVMPLKDVDFRRGTDNAGRVVVSLPNNQTGVDLKVQGQGLVVEFLKTSLPEGLRRRLDVTDFGTPVKTITSNQTGDRVRVLIEPTGDWEHSAYQSDDQFVVEVRPKKVDTSKLLQAPSYVGEKLSLNFQSIDVRSLLQVIADFTNFNIVTSDTVSGNLTLRLKDVPWDQALQIIMDSKGLGMRKSGNVLWIAPRDELDARTKKDLEALQAIERLETLRTQSFQLNYAKASEMVIQLRGVAGGAIAGSAAGVTRFLSERGSVIAEPRTNQLFVTDTAKKLVEVQELLAKLDIPVRQVLIEARIVEASDTFGRSLGVRLGGSDLRGVNGGNAGYALGGGNRVAFGGSYDAVSSTTGETANVMTTTNTSFVNLPAAGQGGYSASSFALSIFNSAANRFLNLEISALEADGKGKVVSSPRVITADQTKALIEQGTEFPYQQATSSGATSVAFRKANLKLEVTPQITPEGNIILDLDINKDSKGETTAQGIAINTKHIKTQVLVENGGTVVIGGIFELTESDSEAKVPLLGDIPVMGNLFKSKTKSTNKQEMLVFITPKMVSDRATNR
ncbi:type IV pilus secretin PilQ [Curvibacter sp. HBC61]|uniref:Type IV pilus biogenesis and competence protein PilQ n=1 Tax=Curvibacter cyanobacteriorum TaxID=3026422 RepID=A0ABT5MYR3_9BURK|nr:type IV pilus secretin PilQ [Curvibacter sp. HBC61]MDD0839174.1 type IV pilus secretin PilQ [Curvibacter sp. HBC61]